MFGSMHFLARHVKRTRFIADAVDCNHRVLWYRASSASLHSRASAHRLTQRTLEQSKCFASGGVYIHVHEARPCAQAGDRHDVTKNRVEKAGADRRANVTDMDLEPRWGTLRNDTGDTSQRCRICRSAVLQRVNQTHLQLRVSGKTQWCLRHAHW